MGHVSTSSAAPHGHAAPARKDLLRLAFLSLGVVFGDIGTSPLYTLKECLHVAAVHGEVGRAVTLNPASIVVIVLAAVLLVSWWRRPVERIRVPVWLVVVAFAALWAYQLFKYATGRPL